jgi:uncharacterized membrane protein YbhN (UPF0104 family)
MARKPTRAQLIQLVFTVLVVAVIAVYLAGINWDRLDGLRLSPLPFVVSILIALVFRYWGAGIWLFLLDRLGARGIRSAWVELCAVYAKAWLGRYLLGAGTWILGKVYFASKFGIGKSKLAVSGVLEGALQLIATLIVGLGLLVIDPRLGALGGAASVVSIVALVVCVIALIPPVFRFGIGLLYRIVRRKRIDPADLPEWRAIIFGGLLYIVGTLITGASYFFIALAVFQDLQWSDFLYIVGASSVAAAISLLAVFAPGGIGVREGAQVFFFSVLMPVELAVIVSVLMRLWSLAVDVLFFLVAQSVRILKDRRGGNQSHDDARGTTG